MSGRRFAPRSLALILLLALILAGCTPGATPAPTAAAPAARTTPVPPTAAADGNLAAHGNAARLRVAPHARPGHEMVERRRLLRDLRPLLPGLRRRRHRRLQGAESKLDYLNDGDPNTTDDLGVTGIWLMPIHAVPVLSRLRRHRLQGDQSGVRHDGGLQGVPRRGAQARHQSHHRPGDEPHLVEASLVRRGAGSRSRPSTTGTCGLRRATGPDWHEAGQKVKYYGAFGGHMPDLNYKNPEVTAAMFDIVRFWLEDVRSTASGSMRSSTCRRRRPDGRARAGHLQVAEGVLQVLQELQPGRVYRRRGVGRDEDRRKFMFPTRWTSLSSSTWPKAWSRRPSCGTPLTLRKPRRRSTSSTRPASSRSFLANHDQNRTRSEVEEDGQAPPPPASTCSTPACRSSITAKRSACRASSRTRISAGRCSGPRRGASRRGEPWNAYFDDEATRNVAATKRRPGLAAQPLPRPHPPAQHVSRPAHRRLARGDRREARPSVYSFMR